jgi:hypothetical protein
MPVIDPNTTIDTAGTYTVNAAFTNERAGITPASISIKNNDVEIELSATSPATADIVLSEGTSGSFSVKVDAVDSLGREYTSTSTYNYDIPSVQVLAAVSYIDPFAWGHTARAFRVYNVTTLEEVTADIPVVAQHGLHVAFSPGGTHLAVVTVDRTLRIYETTGWTSVVASAIVDATDDEGHVSWSSSGRYVCAFVGNKYLLLDKDNAWAGLTLTLPSPSSGGSPYTSAFAGDAGLIVCGAWDDHFSLHEIYSDGTTSSVETITALGGNTLSGGYALLAVPEPPTIGQVLADMRIMFYARTSAESFAQRAYFRTWGGTALGSASTADNISPTPVTSAYFSSDGTQVGYRTNLSTDQRVRRFDASTDAFTELGLLSTGTSATSTDVAWSHARESIVQTSTNGSNYLVLREYDGTALTLTGTYISEAIHGYPGTVSTNDWPVNTYLPPLTPA